MSKFLTISSYVSIVYLALYYFKVSEKIGIPDYLVLIALTFVLIEHLYRYLYKKNNKI